MYFASIFHMSQDNIVNNILKGEDEIYSLMRTEEIPISEETLDVKSHTLVPTPYPAKITNIKDVDKNIKECLETYTMLNEFDFVKNQVVIAGGFITSMIIKKRYKDIDMFIYGKSDIEICNIIFKLYELIKPKNIYRSKNCITFIDDKYSTYQIILRKFASKEDILKSFDNGACSHLYDGTHTWSNYIGMIALKYRMIIADLRNVHSQSLYQYRLSKYFDKGFSIIFPYVTPDKLFIDSDKIAQIIKNRNYSQYNAVTDADSLYEFYLYSYQSKWLNSDFNGNIHCLIIDSDTDLYIIMSFIMTGYANIKDYIYQKVFEEMKHAYCGELLMSKTAFEIICNARKFYSLIADPKKNTDLILKTGIAEYLHLDDQPLVIESVSPVQDKSIRDYHIWYELIQVEDKVEDRVEDKVEDKVEEKFITECKLVLKSDQTSLEDKIKKLVERVHSIGLTEEKLYDIVIESFIRSINVNQEQSKMITECVKNYIKEISSIPDASSDDDFQIVLGND